MIVILGAGLAGLATARTLLGEMPAGHVRLLEREQEPGGVCRTHREAGFTFDMTGHYLHLRDEEIRRFLFDRLGDRLVPVQRRANIYLDGAWLEYPFQAHLHGLPLGQLARCLVDFVEASRTPPPEPGPGTSFAEWGRKLFGDGIAEAFLLPYNAKLYGVDPEELTTEWVGWSVPRPSLEQVVRGALGAPNEGMGYNPRFYVPTGGGIDCIARCLAGEVEPSLELGVRVTAVDARARRVHLADGRELPYDTLVSTIPLPALLRLVRGLEAGVPAGLPDRLRAAAVVELQLGVDRPDLASGTHWIYVPESRLPFYRVGIPSNVCRAMAPAGHGSLSVEVSWTPRRPAPSAAELLEAVRPGLEELDLLRPADRIAYARVQVVDPAYVIFDRMRSAAVEQSHEALARAGVHSIGRFGGWTYSAMETALREGVDTAREVLARTT